LAHDLARVVDVEGGGGPGRLVNFVKTPPWVEESVLDVRRVDVNAHYVTAGVDSGENASRHRAWHTENLVKATVYIDILTTLEAGLVNSAHEDQRTFSASLSRVLCSFNIPDFLRIHSMVVHRPQPRRDCLARQRLSRLAETAPGESMKNRVEFLSRR
jgi:hypothetical protein